MAKRNTCVRVFVARDGGILEPAGFDNFDSVKAAYQAIADGKLGNGPFEVHTVWAEGVELKPKAPEFELSFGARHGGGAGGKRKLAAQPLLSEE